MLDLNHYRAPSRFLERIESNLFVQTFVLLGLFALVGRCGG